MYLVVFVFILFTQKFIAFKFYPVHVCAASLAFPPLRKEEGSGDTLIFKPVTKECNGVGSRVLACYRLHVCNHDSSIYIMLVAMDLSNKRSYVCHPLIGKAAWRVPFVCSLLAILCGHNGC